MTTDLAELHPNKEFHPESAAPNRWKLMPYWVGAGLAALAGTGYAAFTSAASGGNGDAAPSSQQWLTGTPAAPEPESEQIANAIFDEQPEADADEQPEPREGAAPGVALEPTAAQAEDPADEATEETDEPAADGAYYVQLASYRVKEDAEAHVAELASRKVQAKVVAYGGPSAGWWHAVRMGPFEERADAEAQRFTLEPHERRAAYVLPRSNGKFHVQVASFSEVEKAEQVAKRFRAEGHSTKVTRVRMSGAYWHCVRIGPFDTREEALGYKRLVRDIPGSQSTVIPFGPPQQTQGT